MSWIHRCSYIAIATGEELGVSAIISLSNTHHKYNLVPRPPAQTLSRSHGEKLGEVFPQHGCEIKSEREAWTRLHKYTNLV